MSMLILEDWSCSLGRIVPDTAAWDRAQRQRLMETIADLPPPAEYAYAVSLAAAEALSAAVWSRGDWRVANARHLGELRPLGLAEYGGNCLTNFGIAVRREVMVDHG